MTAVTHRAQQCPAPRPRRKYSSRPWICPICGQAYIATRQQPDNIAPTVLSWWWRKWPFTGAGYSYSESPDA